MVPPPSRLNQQDPVVQMRPRRVTVVTGTRAEYGLLRWLMADLREDPRAALTVLATGTHLSDAHGRTIDEITGDGFEVDAKVPLGLDDDRPVEVARAIGAATSGIAIHLERLRPDIVVVLGDRYEILGAAVAATLQRLPLAHLHGGETTEGSFDEAFRHSITKMSHLHFTATETYRRRVIQLGESPTRVWNVGALGVDSVRRVKRLDRSEVQERLGGFDLGDSPLLVTYHSETLGRGGPRDAIMMLTRALDEFPERKVVVTGSNADPGGRLIDRLLMEWSATQPRRVLFVRSLGQQNFLSLLALAGAVVGNSSSGIIEAPALGIPTVNIGDRQAGRLRAASILDCAEDCESVVSALSLALAMARVPATSPYGTAGAAERIRHVLMAHRLEGLLRKHFYEQE